MDEPLLPGDSKDDGWLDFDEVLKAERECIDNSHEQRGANEEAGEPFSLAFSGGGIRAAAFQAGVLWRLAELNRLKDIEYFTAVSGGGYITSAFATHCCAADPPAPGQVRKWYMDVVSKTITRMQNNAGDFVRDCVQLPGVGEEGAGSLPRALDLPILLVTLFCTLMVNPVTFVVVFVVPIVFSISAFYGAAMRAAFCVLPGSYSWWDIFFQFSPFGELIHSLGIVVAATAVVFLLQRLVPSCKLKPTKEGQRPTASMGYLFGHAAYGCLKRLTFLLTTLVLFLFLVPCVQTMTYDPSARYELCSKYIAEAQGAKIDCTDASNLPGASSSDISFLGDTWYTSNIFLNYSHHVKEIEKAEALKRSVIAQDRTFAPGPFKDFFQVSTIYLFFSVWLLLMVVAIFIMPVFGSSALVNTLFITGPMFVLVALLAFVQYSVFGPITKNRNGLMKYDQDSYESGVSWSLVLAFFIIPFYEELRSALHIYYKRCLQGNFFKGGEDMSFSSLAKHPYCPFIILTGTSSDFQPPGDTDVISELSFSALHTGSEETGYVATPDYRSLAKCTALTGAGCLDAISLSMSDALALRFWLEVLNLSWGDYILFQNRQTTLSSIIDQIAANLPLGWKGGLTRVLARGPSGIIWMLAWIWLLIAWHHARNSASAGDCSHFRELLRMAGTAIGGLILLSFFSFLPFLDWLSMSPILRQLQQATKYFYVGSRPPQMLYVTDGGVKDCTALTQLMRRKCKRILLVLAAADPHDDLGVLKTAMDVAKEQKIGCFYDPDDPRKDLSCKFAAFKQDRSIPFLHIGISYCWPGPGEEESTGHIYIVKNRLPPDHERQCVKPLLTPQEVMGEGPPGVLGEEWNNITSDMLGPFGCCDCCHTNSMNCGPKFPHGSFTGYMYLTPQWSNHLTRLGYALSEEAIKTVSRKGGLSAQWEATLV